MDGGAWWAAVHGVSKSRTWLSDLTFTFHFPALEKEMATYSSVLAWRIPGTGEPGKLPSMGSRRVGHDWSDLAVAHANMGFPGGTSGKESSWQCRKHEKWVQSLGQEDPLEKGMTTHSSILAWRILWTEEPGGLQSIRSQRVRHDWSDSARTHACANTSPLSHSLRYRILAVTAGMWWFIQK